MLVAVMVLLVASLSVSCIRLLAPAEPTVATLKLLTVAVKLDNPDISSTPTCTMPPSALVPIISIETLPLGALIARAPPPTNETNCVTPPATVLPKLPAEKALPVTLLLIVKVLPAPKEEP